MQRLIIIGNGFDRAHNLPTAYSDFMEQLTEAHEDFYNAICQYIPEEALWTTFEDALADLDDEQLKDDNLCYLLGYGDENWRDSAHHDFQYMIGEALSFASEIPEYFTSWINSIDIDASPIMPAHIIDKDNLYLSFNYTDTLEKVYNIPTENILYIHGKTVRGDKLIVGHHHDDLVKDEPELKFESEEAQQLYYEHYNEDVRVTEANGVIKSYFKDTYKDTASIIQLNRQFFDSLSAIEEIYIYGHSLSSIDMDYFNEIKTCVSNHCKWNITYHDDEGHKRAETFVKILNLRLYRFYNV